jgi:hypothetical protein
VAAGQASERQQMDRVRVVERRIEMPDGFDETGDVRLRLEHERVGVGLDRVGDDARARRLVPARFGEADREGVEAR